MYEIHSNDSESKKAMQVCIDAKARNREMRASYLKQRLSSDHPKPSKVHTAEPVSSTIQSSLAQLAEESHAAFESSLTASIARLTFCYAPNSSCSNLTKLWSTSSNDKLKDGINDSKNEELQLSGLSSDWNLQRPLPALSTASCSSSPCNASSYANVSFYTRPTLPSPFLNFLLKYSLVLDPEMMDELMRPHSVSFSHSACNSPTENHSSEMVIDVDVDNESPSSSGHPGTTSDDDVDTVELAASHESTGLDFLSAPGTFTAPQVDNYVGDDACEVEEFDQSQRTEVEPEQSEATLQRLQQLEFCQHFEQQLPGTVMGQSLEAEEEFTLPVLLSSSTSMATLPSDQSLSSGELCDEARH